MSIQRVLMTGDTVGGVWTFTLELAEAMAAQGIEVLLVAFGGEASGAQVAQASAIPGVCLLDSALKLEWMNDPWGDLERSGRWLIQLEREYFPDVIHLNTFGHGGLPWRAPVVLTAHSCVLSWWQAVKGERAPASWDRYRNLVKKSLDAADILTAPSKSMAAALESQYGIDCIGSSPCRVIPNGRTAARFRPQVKEHFVLSVGRLWDEAKNVQAVAQIAPALSWPVYLAGHSSFDSNTARLEGCRMLGRLSPAEVAGWYARAAVYAMPARYEPFGLSILEAALSGCALVLGDIPSLREIWQDAALFAPPDDPDALERALQTLVEDSARRQEMSGRAYSRALNFDTGKMSRAYLGTYADAMALRSRQCVS